MPNAYYLGIDPSTVKGPFCLIGIAPTLAKKIGVITPEKYHQGYRLYQELERKIAETRPDLVENN